MSETSQQVQRISVNTDLTLKPDQRKDLSILYDATDPALSGLVLNIHYDSAFINVSDYSSSIQTPIQQIEIFDDDVDLDNDPLTDKYIQFLWATLNSSFPGTSLPSIIANLKLRVNSIIDLPKISETTSIRFTATETASGFRLESSPLDFILNRGVGSTGPISSSLKGIFREGLILSAPVVRDDPDGNAAEPDYSYQWYRNNSAVSGATSRKYLVPKSGSGSYQVLVTYSDAKGFRDTVKSPSKLAGGIVTGTNRADILNGTNGDDLITGLRGADQMTGGRGRDTFRYTSLNQSRLGAIDHITDFAIGTDQIDAPKSVSSSKFKQLGSILTLKSSSIEEILGAQSDKLGKRVFQENSAATFTLGIGRSSRTFLAINDATPGFNARRDSVIDISGFSGDLAKLEII